MRFEAYGWQVLRVEDGNNVDEVADTIGRARESERLVSYTHLDVYKRQE